MTVRYVSAALILGGLTMLPTSFAMSAAQCQGLSKELNVLKGKMVALQTELNADKPVLEDLQIKRNDAVEVRRFSKKHEAKAVELETEYDAKNADYNTRLSDLSSMNQSFGEKRQKFLDGCKAYLPKK